MNAGLHRIAAATALSLSTALTLSAQDPPAPAGSPDSPVLLRLAPPEGQVSRYAMTVQMDTDSPMMPSTGPLMTMRAHQTQFVLGVEDEVVRMRTTIDSTATTMGVAMPRMDMLPDFAGSVFTGEFDTRGRLLGGMHTEGLPTVDGFDPESLFQNTGHFILPEEEVSPGDSWTQGAPMSLPMGPAGSVSVEVSTTYTFLSLEGSLATISFEGPIDMDMDMAVMEVTATGTMTGMMVVDLAEGRFHSQSSQTSLDMDMGAMTMKVISTTTMELIPDP